MNNLFLFGTIIIAASALLQGLSGFGFSILSLPLLAVYISPKTAVPMLLIFSIVLNLSVIATCWRSFSIRNIWLLLLGGSLGIPIGTHLLASDSGWRSPQKRNWFFYCRFCSSAALRSQTETKTRKFNTLRHWHIQRYSLRQRQHERPTHYNVFK